MDTEQVIAELEAERDRLDLAIGSLRGGKADGRKRHKSTASKRRISEGMRKSWARRKRLGLVLTAKKEPQAA